ncbi:beta-lactamase family protein [Flavobacteriaceae bacterium F08102]|nr:beta-lactamase family protein [Flavobacteriaceae bacterium F08102]
MNRKNTLALNQIIQQDYPNIAGIIILKNNTIIHENYFNQYRESDTIHIASITKSIISILIGIAIDKGYIKNTDQPVLDFFPKYQVKKREKTIQNVTIKHLLTMTAPFKYRSEPYTKVYSSEDWTKSVLDLLGGKKLSRAFKYTTIGLQVLSGILTNATGKSVRDFASDNVFTPLGIKTPNNLRIRNKKEYFSFLKETNVNGWVIDPKGIHTAGWGLTLSTRDLAKIGQLYLNHGTWNTTQIISARWIKESTKKHSQLNDIGYGYLWWIIDNKENYCFSAIGDGGNILYIDRAKQAIVVITSEFMPRAKDRIALIKKHIIPTIL